MKIKEFSIIRYGPLPNTGRISLHNFNLFFGNNEDGKTLTIDALVKLLLERNIKDFARIDRVEENPEGYVIIETDDVNEIKLPEKGNLTKVADLTPSECRNIFIIRNSDLSIAPESEFYTNVTNRLTGLRTEEISKIKNKLKELGRLTRAESSADLSDTFGGIKSRVKNAMKLIEKITGLAEEIKKERFDELEEEAARYSEEIDRIKQQIGNFEDARKREKYETGKQTLDKLKEALGKLKDLEIYNEEDEQLWRDCERDIQASNEEKERLMIELNEKEQEFKETNEKLEEKERGFQIFEERKKKIDDEIKPQLKIYERKREELAPQEEKNKFFTSIGIISAILLGISLLGIIVSPLSVFYILAVLFLISTIVSWIFKFRFIRGKAWLAEAVERINLTLSKFGLSTLNIEGILSNIQKFDEEYRKNFDEIQDIKRKKETLEYKINELRNKAIPDTEKKIKGAQDIIDKIKGRSRQETLTEYGNNLKLKQQHEESLKEQRSILESHFGAKGTTMKENISHWNGGIEDLEEYKDKAINIRYNEINVSRLKEKESLYVGKFNELQEKMSGFQKKLEDIEREANGIVQLKADYLHCKTSVDLDSIGNKVQEFITENESNKDNVLEVIRIFEEIESEEKARVSELFGKDSSISDYFNKITGRLYEEVLFNQQTGKIEVRRKDGVILKADKLSGGAYDQLYLSIRLALGEKLLKGEKGFFIMDDPFVKADPDRLHRQIEMLKRISEWGWQVIFFSAKGEIKDVLKENINSGTINYVEVQGIFS